MSTFPMNVICSYKKKKSRQERDVESRHSETNCILKEHIWFKLCFRHLHTQMSIGVANNCWVITLNGAGPHQLATEG